MAGNERMCRALPGALPAAVFAVGALLSACDSGPSCADVIDQLCTKACACGSPCAIDFGGPTPSTYASQAACVSTFSPCSDPRASFSASACNAAVASAQCVVMDGGLMALPAQACEYTAD